jgi:glycosyltransferase involved in cell wall biosynthesis
MVLTPHGILHDGDLVVDRERPLENPLRPERLLMTGAQLRTAIMHGAHPRRSIRNYLIHAPLHGYHGIMALSQHEKDVLVGLHMPAERITVVPNAVELQQYVDAPPRPRHAQPTILFIGQLVPRKGWDLAVRALPLIAQHIPDVRMVMVTHNTSQRSEFEALATSLGIMERITLLTSVDEAQKIQLLQEAHLLLAPSRYEGFGIPPIEAMAAHCPVVTTDCAAGNEIVHHEKTGLLVAYDDVAGYAAATVRILKDDSLRTQLINAGYDHVIKDYTPITVAQQSLEYYHQRIATFHK